LDRGVLLTTGDTYTISIGISPAGWPNIQSGFVSGRTDNANAVGARDLRVVPGVARGFVDTHRPVASIISDGCSERSAARETVPVVLVDASRRRGVDTAFADTAWLGMNPNEPATTAAGAFDCPFVVGFTELVADHRVITRYVTI